MNSSSTIYHQQPLLQSLLDKYNKPAEKDPCLASKGTAKKIEELEDSRL